MYAVVLLLGILPQGADCDTTDLVEVNHCYNGDTGERRFVQVIYWDRVGACLHVRDWHMVEKCHSIYSVPERTEAPFTIVRHRECDGTLQVIRAKRYKVTHTYTDPEEEDRKVFPLDRRRPLGR